LFFTGDENIILYIFLTTAYRNNKLHMISFLRECSKIKGIPVKIRTEQTSIADSLSAKKHE